MKERPILFSAPMVRALLGGTKTQTRRIVKPQPVLTCDEPGLTRLTFKTRNGRDLMNEALQADPPLYPLLCPYGERGDQLWVRETWGYFDPDGSGQDFEDKNSDGGNGPRKCYAPELMQEGHQLREYWRRRIAYAASWQEPRYGAGPDAPARWRPSIHMPRWASRILLEVTEVRVERLQDISETDAAAEGIGPLRSDGRMEYGAPATDGYADLWEQINGPGSWDRNPWVWCVSFKRVQP